ncbi:hypothetical protein NVIE_1836 [Nitrososphaera viennensis EN76]|uniref:Transmembrane protein n=1 Tax=Nitrososphaera viennensis EN76 TaxID=926571 RepID=A0A060HSB6_9ARCH|nr:hypothetical protein NVIE_1836 [Nitrososphaera viennensis EN76]
MAEVGYSSVIPNLSFDGEEFLVVVVVVVVVVVGTAGPGFWEIPTTSITGIDATSVAATSTKISRLRIFAGWGDDDDDDDNSRFIRLPILFVPASSSLTTTVCSPLGFFAVYLHSAALTVRFRQRIYHQTCQY